MSYFLFADNQTLLKYALYLLRFMALTYLIFLVLRLEIHLSSGLEIVFYVHASAIILSFIFPVLHDFLRLYFTYEGGSPFRFSGFIQGYDFVPFIMTIYLAYEYLNLSKRINAKFIFKLSLGIIASLLSGRYGIVPVVILLAYILLDSRYFVTKVGFTVLATFCFIFIFGDVVQNIYQTSLMLVDYAKYGIDYDFSKYWNDTQRDKGQYVLSPITLLQEITLPLYTWKEHLLPTSIEINLDPGPSYMMMNLGFLITVLLYIFFFKFIKNIYGISIPFIVITIFIIIDLKFKSLYVLMPTLWLLLNHANYANQNKSF